jgi:putative hydrolase of HD superfamily
MSEKNLLKLMFELGILSRTPRTGPYHVGLTNHETSAAHSFRTTALAYFIAQEENADVNKVLKMCLVHDFPETRLLNQTFIQGEFYSVKNKFGDVLSKQLRNLKGSKELEDVFGELTKGGSKESKIVQDANTLEALIEAKEYIQQGIKIMERWFLDKKKQLKTKTAIKILDVLEKEKIYCWM